MPNAPVITAPAAGAVLNTSPYRIEWTHVPSGCTPGTGGDFHLCPDPGTADFTLTPVT